MDQVTHLCRRRFHHVIKCPRTGDRVSFALIGSAWDRLGSSLSGRGDVGESGEEGAQEEREHDGDFTDVILFLLPAGCSRYIGIPSEKVCDEENVRL